MNNESTPENIVCFQKIKKEKVFKNLIHEKGIGYILSSLDITLDNIEFKFISSFDKVMCTRINHFIVENEWLAKNIARPTHRFVAMFNDEIIAVVVMGTPYAPSDLLGRENAHLEKLLGRGASTSLAPKNIGSWINSRAIDWMSKNTEFRLFTAYCDSRAGEIGTIYSALNFIYLGKKFGARKEYYDIKNPQRGWFNSRLFRRVGSYKRYAKTLGIEWQDRWCEKWTIKWERIPLEVIVKLKDKAKEYEESCLQREPGKKHKYICIKGNDKRETKQLLALLKKINPKLTQSNGSIGFPYPKVRGE
jgi:hypothetical protein